jgi:hypothetical protein
MKVCKVNELPPGVMTTIPPTNGWEENTVYWVKVSFSKHNPIHKAIFFSGFLTPKREPGVYNTLFNPSYGRNHVEYHNIHYLEVVKILDIDFM